MAIGRFIQADTIVPSPGNPQSLNRYAYTLNNPLKYTDPTGHFTDDAIKAYLENQYGDEWESYWKVWRENDAWMKLLSNAQGDDTLYRVSFDDSGDPGWDYFQFDGEGQNVLTGINKVAIGKDPEKADLHNIFINRGQGIGGIHWDDDGDLVNLGTVGNIQAMTYKTSQADNIEGNVISYLGLFGLGTEGGALMWLAGAIGLAQVIKSPDINDMPGWRVGDNELLVSYNASPWAYQESLYFRNGENIGKFMSVYQYTPYVGRTH